MLRNRRGATSLRWLRALLDHGIEVHGQVVVCPGVNDGEVLDDTLAGVLDVYPELATRGLRPLGVSRYTTEATMRAHTEAEAAAVVDLVEEWQDDLRGCPRPPARVRRRRVLPGGRPPVPRLAAYEGWPSTRTAWAWPRAFEAAFPGATGRDRRGARAASSVPSRGRPRSATGRPGPPGSGGAPAARRRAGVAVLTGEYGARGARPAHRPAGGRHQVVAVRNEFFGGNIAVAGLLTGVDLSAGPRPPARGPPLPPPRQLPVGGLFLDGVARKTCPGPSKWCPRKGRRYGVPWPHRLSLAAR